MKQFKQSFQNADTILRIISISSDNERSVIVRLQIDDSQLKLTDTPAGTRVRLGDWRMTGAIGGPALPTTTIWVALPKGMRATDLNVSGKASVVAEKCIMLAPHQPPRFDVPDVPATPLKKGKPQLKPIVNTFRPAYVRANPKLYQRELSQPRPLASIASASMIGDMPSVAIEISPFRLNQQRIELTRQLQIRINIEPESPINTPTRVRTLSLSQSARLSQLAHAIVVNPQDVPALRFDLPPPDMVDYLIVTDNQIWDGEAIRPTGAAGGDLVSAFQKLADWKNQLGMQARVVSITDIVGGVFGDFRSGSADLPSIIRKFIRWTYEKWGVAWVLLGGDPVIVPIRTIKTKSPWGPGDAEVPTDFYYSNLYTRATGIPTAYEWIDGRSIDYFPDVSVGRAPARSGDEADIFVRKVIAYEQLRQPDGTALPIDWLRRMLIANTPWNNGPGWDLPTDIRVRQDRQDKLTGNDYYHENGAPYTIIKLPEFIDVQRKAAKSPPGDNQFFHLPGSSSTIIKLWFNLKEPAAESLIVQVVGRSDASIAYRGDATANVRGWFFTENETNLKPSVDDKGQPKTSNWAVIYSQNQEELDPQAFKFKLKNGFREPQNLLVQVSDGDIRFLPFNRSASPSVRGWFFATDGTSLQPTVSDAGGVVLPSPWIVLYTHDPGELAPVNGCFTFDPTGDYGKEGAMGDQERLRWKVAHHIPEWDMVTRLYEDEFDLSPEERNETDLYHITASRVREQLDRGQHIVSLCGHGSQGGTCFLDNIMADHLQNGYRCGIFFADSCSTNRFVDDSVSEHLLRNPNGGAVAYMGHMTNSITGLSKLFQIRVLCGFQMSDYLGIAHDTRISMLTAPGGSGDQMRYTILSMSLLGDPALRISHYGDYVIRTWRSNCLTAVGGGGRANNVLRTDGKEPGPWDRFTLIPLGGGQYALRTLNGHYLTAVGGGGKTSDAFHTDTTTIGPHEKFKLVQLSHRLYALKTANGYFVSAVEGGGKVSDALQSNAVTVDDYEKFILQPQYDINVDCAFKTDSGNYLTAMDGGGRTSDVIHTNAVCAGPWERFQLIPLGAGKYALQTMKRYYLNAVNGGGKTSDAVHSDAAVIGPWEKFTLIHLGENKVAFQTLNGQYLTAVGGGGKLTDSILTTATTIGQWEQFTIVAEHALRTVNSNYLTAVGGGGKASDAVHTDAVMFGPWEKFSFVFRGPQYALQTADGHYLTAMNGGGQTSDVLHTNAFAIGPWEKFTLLPLGENRYALRTYDGHYLTAVNGGGKSSDVMHTDAKAIGPWEKFTLVELGPGEYALRTINGQFVTSVGGGGKKTDVIHTDTNAIGPHERFLLLPQPGERWAIKTLNGHYFTAVNGGGKTSDAVHTDAIAIGPYEEFTFLPIIGNEDYSLKTYNENYLTAVDGGRKTTDAIHTDAIEIEDFECFLVEPGYNL